jgi:hypothetical protein
MTVLRASHALLALVLGVLVTGCRWDEASAFQEELRCGMSPGEVESLAQRFAVESFRSVDEPNRYVTHVLDEGSTFFEFYFGESGLETVRRGASTGLTTGTSYEPRVNLCTGEITDSLLLRIKGSQDLAGAVILVDGEPRGRLSKGPGYQMSIGLATGPHEIRIQQEGFEPIVIPVDYGPKVEADEIVLPLPEPRSS